MKIPKKVEKIDLRKVNLNKPYVWNLWQQFNVDIDEERKGKIDVTKHYMHEEDMNKIKEYMLKHNRKCKAYKSFHRSKKKLEEIMAWEFLCYAPATIKED